MFHVERGGGKNVPRGTICLKALRLKGCKKMFHVEHFEGQKKEAIRLLFCEEKIRKV